MANDLIKAIIKGATVLVTGGFTAKVASEGRKNLDTWKASRNKQSQNNNTKR